MDSKPSWIKTAWDGFWTWSQRLGVPWYAILAGLSGGVAVTLWTHIADFPAPAVFVMALGTVAFFMAILALIVHFIDRRAAQRPFDQMTEVRSMLQELIDAAPRNVDPNAVLKWRERCVRTLRELFRAAENWAKILASLMWLERKTPDEIKDGIADAVTKLKALRVRCTPDMLRKDGEVTNSEYDAMFPRRAEPVIEHDPAEHHTKDPSGIVQLRFRVRNSPDSPPLDTPVVKLKSVVPLRNSAKLSPFTTQFNDVPLAAVRPTNRLMPGEGLEFIVTSLDPNQQGWLFFHCADKTWKTPVGTHRVTIIATGENALPHEASFILKATKTRLTMTRESN